MEIIRNLTRRRLRTILTTSGIIIGIFALTTMGAMAEKFNTLVDGGARYLSAGIQVSPEGSFVSLLSTTQVAEIERVQGVRAAFPEVQVDAKPGQSSSVNFSFPDYIASRAPEEGAFTSFPLSVATGRDLSATSRSEVVMGADIAREFRARVGSTLSLPVRPPGANPDFVSHRFTVIGILNTTRTEPDEGAFVSLADAQMLLRDSLPAAVRGQLDSATLVSSITAYGAAGASIATLDRVADRISAEVPGVKAQRPSDLVASFKAAGATLTTVTTAAAVLALFVGGLSVINTMLMAVTERMREIGLKKAVGARTGQVLREYVLESALIGLIGGLSGYLLGVGLTNLLNALGRDSKLDIFLVTPNLTVIALGFAVVMGAGAGFIPALRAARMDPVAALRTVA